MKEILFIADDFGASEEINEAIVRTHRNGALHGASLMLGQRATDHAVALARANPALQIGWHLHLVDSEPCTLPSWPWPDSPAGAGFALGLLPRARQLARQEIAAQWRALEATGLRCRFVNAHHHLHVHPLVRATLRRTLPANFSGWVRWGRPCFFDNARHRLGYRLLHRLLQQPFRASFPRRSTTLWGIDRQFRMNATEIASVLTTLGEGRHEFLFHPRRRDDADSRCLFKLGRSADAGKFTASSRAD